MSAGKKIWNVTWRIVVCALLLGWIFNAIFSNEAKLAAPAKGIVWEHLSKPEQWQMAWKFGPAELWHTASSVTVGSLVLSILLVGVTVFLGVIRWRMVLEVQGLHLPFGRALEISLVSQFFNSFLLGSSGGDLMKAYYAARETHHKKTEAVTTVFVDRLIGLWSMLFFAGIMMLLNLDLLWRHTWLGATATLILGMLFACSIILFLAFWGGLSKRWPAARASLRKLPKGELLERSLDSCRQFGFQKKFLAKAVIISLVLNIFVVLHAVALVRGLHLPISALALFVIVPIIVCIAALPITPSGLGVRENLFVAMLTVPEIGASNTSALSLSLLIYATSLFWSVVGGIVYLCLKEKQHLGEITHAEGGE